MTMSDGKYRYSITGTGVSFVQYRLSGSAGLVTGIVLRELLTGLATAGTVYVIDDDGETTYTSVSWADEDVALETAPITLTPSDTVASLDTPVDLPKAFTLGATLVVNVTAATGAFTLAGHVQIGNPR